MPDLIKSFASGEDRFNFMLALSGYLLRNDGQAQLDEVANHFGVDPALVKQTLNTLNVASAKFENRPEDLFYEIDIDLLDEGQIQFRSSQSAPDVPALTTKQASALASGLQYLRTIPDFASETEISELLELLGAGESAEYSPAIEVRSSTRDDDSDLVRKAIIAKRQISCEYLNQRGELSQRVIDPLRLSLDGQHFYLTGWCHSSQGSRIFRLDRMRKVVMLDSEVSAAAEQSTELADQTYVAAATDYEVLVEVDPEAYRLISEVQAIPEPKDSESATIRAVIRVGHLPNLGRLISRYGGAARVISPPEAREVVKQYALRILGENVVYSLDGIEE